MNILILTNFFNKIRFHEIFIFFSHFSHSNSASDKQISMNFLFLTNFFNRMQFQ